MPYNYSQETLFRRHGPKGYKGYQRFKHWLRDDCTFRCAYCLFREKWNQDGHSYFGVDHIISKSTESSLECDYTNLVYACNYCNSCKGKLTHGLDPFTESFEDLVSVSEDGTIRAKCARGTLMIKLFNLDSLERTRYRSKIISVVKKLSTIEDRREWMGFPDNLPDLRLLLPPQGNDRPEGVEECYFVLRERGQLPVTY